MMQAIVFATSAYEWALRPFAYLFNRYWGEGQEVIYVGEKTRPGVELPGNFSYMQVPCYKEGIWPWRHWFGNGVKETLRVLDDDIVAIFLPDHWITGSVRLDVVEALESYMTREGNIVRGNLTDDTSLEGHGRVVETLGDIDIIVCGDIHHCGKEAGVALSPALWSRKLFMEILEPHWGLWGTEKLGTEKMVREHPYWKSVGSRPAALSRTNGLRDGKVREAAGWGAQKVVWVEGLREEDQAVVRGMAPRGYEIIG